MHRSGACLHIDGLCIVVASHKVQMADQEVFRFAKIESTRAPLLVVKSSAHFRADFTPIAQMILVCVQAGSMLLNAAKQPWTRLRPGIRMAPCGPIFLLDL
ncbi:MAG: MlrC C-terminal domain-containing protein [Pseudomonas sp.]